MPVPDFVVELRRMIGTHPLWLPGVTAVVRRERRVLLVRRSDNGAWTPVTGILDPGEEPAAGAAREVLEETGVTVRVDRLAATSAFPDVVHVNGDRASYLDLTFACTWLDGEAHVADDESSEVGWFSPDDLPPMAPAMLERIDAALSDETAARFAGGGGVAAASEPEPMRPGRPVLGVDACRSGWVGVLVQPDGRLTVHSAASIAALVSLVRETAEPAVVAIDIPIGLPDTGGREADAQARRQLPGKGSSVFTTLTRAAYEADTYEQARAANLASTGGAASASAQAYALRARVLDVDAWLRTGPRTEVIEAHPELSFARLAGAPVLPGKTTPEGVLARREALRAHGVAAPPAYRGSGFSEDDLLDACAAAWTAHRHERGVSESFPSVPERFSDGVPAAIRV